VTVPAKKTHTRAPNEVEEQMVDWFGSFEVEYVSFVEWIRDSETDTVCVIIEFPDDNPPEEYKNKWDRQQWKKRVLQDEEDRVLSGGKRLWSAFVMFCKKTGKLPSELGLVRVDRIGSGFETRYKFSIN